MAPPRRAALRKRLDAQAGAGAARRCKARPRGGKVSRRLRSTRLKAARRQSGGRAVGAGLGGSREPGGPLIMAPTESGEPSQAPTWHSGGRKAARAGGGLNRPLRGHPAAGRLRQRSGGHAQAGWRRCRWRSGVTAWASGARSTRGSSSSTAIYNDTMVCRVGWPGKRARARHLRSRRAAGARRLSFPVRPITAIAASTNAFISPQNTRRAPQTSVAHSPASQQQRPRHVQHQ